MDRKKIWLYCLAFFALMMVSMLFSLGIDKAIESLPGYHTGDFSTADPAMESSDRSSGSDDITAPVNEKEDSVLSGKDTGEKSLDANDGDLLPDESTVRFYEERDRGNDLADRYDELAIKAEFDTDCGEIETDRIMLVRQLRGYLENVVEGGSSVEGLFFYKNGPEYFVTVRLPDGERDFHILKYGESYDFESVFITD